MAPFAFGAAYSRPSMTGAVALEERTGLKGRLFRSQGALISGHAMHTGEPKRVAGNPQG